MGLPTEVHFGAWLETIPEGGGWSFLVRERAERYSP